MAETLTAGLRDGVVVEASERDVEICRLYMGGLTLKQVGEHFKLTRERVRQILREGGVYKSDRKREAAAVRDAFLGINISESDKVAVFKEAEKQGISMSALTAGWIKEKLNDLSRGSDVRTTGV